jgi:ribosomal protein S18 acetylase RimI-like enzyme
MAADLELRPATSFELDELAALLTRGYEGYSIPFEVDADAVRFMARTFDLDPSASRVAVRAGKPVGLANLGARGKRGWIGGLGVVASARRQGVGRVLMEAVHDEARARGLEVVRLEVLEANDAAFLLYEQLGYELVRWLEIGTLPEESGGKADEVPAEEVLALVRAGRPHREPWQREDETLAHYDDLRGLVAGSAAAVFRAASGRVTLLQHTGAARDLEDLLRALRAQGPVTLFNVPAGDPLLTAFSSLGGTVALRQRELELELSALPH